MKILNLMTLSFFISLFPMISYSKVKIEKIAIEHQKMPMTISLKTVLLKDTTWTTPLILNEFKKANEIFLQCGVQIKEIDLAYSDFSGKITELYDLGKILENLKEIKFRVGKESIVVFSSEVAGDFLEEAGPSAGGVSFNKSDVASSFGEIPEGEVQLVNVSVLYDIVHTEKYRSQRNAGYTPLAHELAHIFLDSGHLQYPNLLGSGALLANTQLTKDQCLALRMSPALLPLSK